MKYCQVDEVNFMIYVGCKIKSLPVPASPFVRIIAAPSEILRKASPKSRAPHTNGTLKSCLFIWFSSSAGVNTTKRNKYALIF